MEAKMGAKCWREWVHRNRDNLGETEPKIILDAKYARMNKPCHEAIMKNTIVQHSRTLHEHIIWPKLDGRNELSSGTQVVYGRFSCP